MSKYPPWSKFKDCKCRTCERHHKLRKIIDKLESLEDQKFLEDFEYELECLEYVRDMKIKKDARNYDL